MVPRPICPGLWIPALILVFIGLTTAQLDCFTDNGGCSHFCSSDACSCPPCWQLDADGLTCVPDPNHVTTTCGPSGMSIDVDECVYNGDTMTLTLNDGNCTGQGSSSWFPDSVSGPWNHGL